MNKIKVAIIGAGNISNTRHIPGLLLLLWQLKFDVFSVH